MDHVKIAVSTQVAPRPTPTMAGQKHLIEGDRTTAQTPWRQPFFCHVTPRHALSPRELLHQFRGQRSSDLTTFA